MKEIRWNVLENERLKKARGASFEDLINSKLIKIMKNPKHVNQNIILFEYKKYIWVVPFVEEKEYYFLKTLFPSRKYTKIFKGAMI
ncbi:MAG: UDP-N-acetylmuramate--L-alanine ligase [Candidatus Brocadiaceae bacterium]|nr:UDP-N-acetylmuramate--L-alanine ligase [Candidatus Brocadiaceae bacterium]